MSNRKKYDEALDWLYSLSVSCKEEVHEHRSSFLGEKYNLIKQLINEHFENPPLKFEELIKHEVVWDNKVKEYAFVLEQYKPTLLNVFAPNDLLAISLKYRCAEEIECLLSQEVGESINDYFVPNRFYRKQVEE